MHAFAIFMHKFYVMMLFFFIEPACNRLFCVCHRSGCQDKKEFNDHPYGEAGMPWPWNIKR